MKKLIIALALLPATSVLVLASSAHAAEKLPKLLLGLWCSTSTPSSTYEKNGKCSKEESNDSWFELSPDGYEDYVNSCKTVSITVSIVERRGLVPVYSLVYSCGGSGKIVSNKEITVLLQGETLTLLNTRSWDVRPEDAPKATLLRSLPADVQKYIEETRATCRSSRGENSFVPSGDDGLTQFTLGGRKAVLVDAVELCGGCFHGISCDNRGERDVRVYALFKNAWKMVLSNMNITGDIFVSYVPGKYRPEGQELNALVVDLYVGNKECPTRTADRHTEHDQRDALRQTQFQFHPRHRIGRSHQPQHPCHGGASIGSGQDGSRVHRARQGQSGKDQYGVRRPDPALRLASPSGTRKKRTCSSTSLRSSVLD